jgi:hypothetical protein
MLSAKLSGSIPFVETVQKSQVAEGGTMTTRDDFTPDEWHLISRLPVEIAAAASVAEENHEAGSTRELLAAISTLLSGAMLLRHNALVQAVFDEYKADGRGEAELLELSQDPPADFVDVALEQTRQAVTILAERPNRDEAIEFKLWLRGIASDIVMSSARGGFLGIGRAPVTEAEATFLDRLTNALGLRPSDIE